MAERMETTREIKGRGLLWNVTWMTLVSVSVVLVLFGAYQYQQRMARLETQLEIRANRAMDRLAANLRRSLF